MSVSNRLLRLDEYLLKSKILQYSLYRSKSRSVKRCINDCNVFCHLLDNLRMDREITEFSEILLINLVGNNLIETCFNRLILIHCLNHIKGSHLGNLIHNVGVMWRSYLCAILPIYFISIVFSWIMTCSNNNTCDTSKLTNCERQLRNRTKTLEYISLNSICCKA